MTTDPIDAHFTASVSALTTPDSGPLRPLELPNALQLFDAQLGSRHLDLAARWLRSQGKGFYTIGSSGHEGNAAVAAALRPTDPALLHYRSGGFYLARAAQVAGTDPLRDVLLGLVAATAEPISGGRHKVFGRHDLNIIPQTSTIASHLPRSVGVAFSIARTRKLGVPCCWPADAVTVCSFGDASANHSTTVGAVNAALHATYQGLPMPLLFVCEDNGLGISTPTPRGWIAHAYGNREGLKYFAADGCDLVDVAETARAAADWVRRERKPAFLHLRTVRLMGHAGSDYEQAYRPAADIVADYDRDPVLATARTLVAHGVLSPQQALQRYEDKRAEVMDLAREVGERPQLDSAGAVMQPLRETLDDARTVSVIGPGERGGPPLTLALAINRALHEILQVHPEAMVFGEDVARKGGVYGVTRGLQAAAGPARVFDTLLDEQTILGLALGSGVSGLVPIPEIQYLAYLHNAADQIRGEGATLQFFSNRQYRNPMVVRIAGYGYQKGFGGHFHNDNSIAAIRDIPGVVIASPSRPDDAAAMLHTCVTAAKTVGAVCIYLEPIALYHTKDLYSDGDEQWLADYPQQPVRVGAARTYGDGADLTILTFANGVRMSLRVAARLEQAGIAARVVDLRWLSPLPVEDMLRESDATGRVLIVDETRRTGGVGEGVLAELADHGFTGRVQRVSSADSFIPLGDAALEVLLSEDTIEAAAVKLVGQPA
ncbi:thiamine pyrophosphate-dependent enzyme [Mycolicibacterium fortuitum]|uniref:Transketolase, central region n=1 Tax=Mycolicibacterium fortuitum subsp. fortuitum DSM 46621 = ATCC 6841 = JCM 6387 TaxID=1214102 RepID=K0V702_MYCFO|nr:thiamine pyrophosphate-dependent enzyme [Mycolicibacterium fortuitum]AIY46146.1 Branched-chain alpha-keto acid dehydrogenase, E1 component, alpha subunit [Mycobacterium sp. VKM Ac-1817D]CRL81696.1 transketolase, central region [Mycolicibacter nonchromogenicus]EJZ10583.1 transketolase, central region [Mycolicibacterium fortuitum subsp. fortuitum DSM 46621 = ATCC 6841 = JCM 6387]WEV35026.1 thiamine pyrophosphate-dependent enzyme [Mycolicibacterium fortuitum]CRL55447.1 transketolase, central r